MRRPWTPALALGFLLLLRMLDMLCRWPRSRVLGFLGLRLLGLTWRPRENMAENAWTAVQCTGRYARRLVWSFGMRRAGKSKVKMMGPIRYRVAIDLKICIRLKVQAEMVPVDTICWQRRI